MARSAPITLSVTRANGASSIGGLARTQTVWSSIGKWNHFNRAVCGVSGDGFRRQRESLFMGALDGQVMDGRADARRR